VNNHGEMTFRVPPLSKSKIEQIAYEFLRELDPDMLRSPKPLDLYEIFEQRMVRSTSFSSIFVYPAELNEIPFAEGDTSLNERGEVVIRLRSDVYDEVCEQGNRGRATCAHELGHAVLHKDVLNRLDILGTEYGLRRKAEVKAYEDAEWQAWAFAGCIMMPPTTFCHIDHLSPTRLAQIYGVSFDFANSHLKRYPETKKRPRRVVSSCET
jgi:hypothetical protein